jgi:hypothetical protein
MDPGLLDAFRRSITVAEIEEVLAYHREHEAARRA